jgi:polyisoprenyl-phosphate glycosyltransferase
MRPGKTNHLLSVVVPVHNERDVLPEFHRRLGSVLDSMAGTVTEVLYVNDGSTDRTLETLQHLRAGDARVAVLDLSRNFGKEIALAAGLDFAQGDAVVVIDADLQDPPELLPVLVKYWQQGYDNVYAKRIARHGETLLKKATARAFYGLIRKISRVEIPADTGDFRLLSRRAVVALQRLREQHRFTKGLFAWVGYKSKEVTYERDPRFAGGTKWSYWRLWNFAIEGITSFSTAPLKIATYLGVITAVAAFAYGTFIVIGTLIYGNPVAGYPSIMAVVLFLGGVQLVGLGIVGEYLGRTFNEVKNRPLYFVSDYVPAEATKDVTRTDTAAPRNTT